MYKVITRINSCLLKRYYYSVFGHHKATIITVALIVKRLEILYSISSCLGQYFYVRVLSVHLFMLLL
jgi:hypothetical protein